MALSDSLRTLVKSAARGAALVAVSPELASYWMRARVMGPDRALEGSTQLLALVPGIPGQYLRRAFLSRTLAHCAPSASIGFGTVFSKSGARIDDNAYIGAGCHLGLVHVGRDVMLASGVHVPSGAQTHGSESLDVPMREQPGRLTMVHIGAGAWVGSAAVVMADVGADTIVAAGAVVTKPLPERSVAGGVPAKVLKSREAAAELQPPSREST